MAAEVLELAFEEKIRLMELIMELRQSIPIGVVGLLETRDLLADLFPEFDKVRDHDIDKLIEEYAANLGVSPELQYGKDSAILERD